MIERQKEKYGWEFCSSVQTSTQLKRQGISELVQTERSTTTLTMRERSSTMKF